MTISICPFCGGNAESSTTDYEIEGNRFASVSCVDEDSCGAIILVYYKSDIDKMTPDEIKEEAMAALQEAISRWNKRI